MPEKQLSLAEAEQIVAELSVQAFAEAKAHREYRSRVLKRPFVERHRLSEDERRLRRVKYHVRALKRLRRAPKRSHGRQVGTPRG